MIRKISFIALLVICGMCLCSAKGNSLPQTEESKPLTLVTYNVGAFGKAGYDTMPVCVGVIKSFASDAVALNELDSCNTRSGADVYQMEKIAGQMGGWPFIYASAIPYKGGSYGIGAMVSPSHKVIDKWTAKLPKSDGREVRALAVIETEKFVFCSTHLDLTDASQIAQVDEIYALISSRYKDYEKPVFLCGDMNAEPGSATIQRLQNNWTLLSSTEFSFSSSNPRKCIDFIFSFTQARQVSVVKAQAVPIKDASDHFPQVVVVRL